MVVQLAQVRVVVGKSHPNAAISDKTEPGNFRNHWVQ